ncbi:MAG: hypothetical protein SPD85_01515 [Candidatus Cryptobacteroides sp.]|nr:hypothetical protein [Candidatus Cryptobacteroides sp.]
MANKLSMFADFPIFDVLPLASNEQFASTKSWKSQINVVSCQSVPKENLTQEK